MVQSETAAATYAWDALRLMEQWDDDEALVSYDGRRFTYAQLRQRVLRMSVALWNHGVRTGQTIGVYTYNPPEAIFLQLAAHLFGARTAWVAPSAPLRFRHDFIRLAGIDAFVYDSINAADYGEEMAQLAAPLPVLCFGSGGAGPDLTAEPLPGNPSVERLPFDPNAVTSEPSSLFQTGGTTGLPKLVHHRQHFFRAIRAMADAYRASDAPRLRHLLPSGTWHVSAQTAAFMTLFSGGTLYLQEGVNNADFLAVIENERVNSTLLMPAQLYELLDDPLLGKTDTSSLGTLSISGGPAAPARVVAAIERFGPIVRLIYGMSESPFLTAQNHVTIDPDRPERLSSCGLPFGDVKIEIRAEDGTLLPAGTDGDIWASGSLVMAEYFGQPDLTRNTIIDGWLNTGDIGRLDDDGYLYIVDRAKDMIITGIGASNVFCRPVEDILMSHPSVRGAAVVGVPHPLTGERVHAFVVTAPGSTLTEEELLRFALERLNVVWVPKAVTFVSELPLTPSGKYDKKEMRDRHIAAQAEKAAAEGTPT